ncbi:hypothetical protein GTX53_24470 [Streptomyces sp. SID5594]|uniref:hypothetical protein n=1 Tax=unclassified Streptomyces TaxID=2593676 RepID=UPI00036F9809|nr:MULTISPECIES: hypothetical protein [unclassified Streptomyces]MZF56948.1 hypothetical protein [Streptomyces sp. SID5594]
MTTRTATNRADDEVFDFNLNAVESETDLKPFVFLWASKKEPNRRFTMQHLEGLDVWPLMAAADNGDASATIGIFRAAMGDEWEEFRKTPLPQYKMKSLFAAYRKHCGTSAGELEASSGS